MDGGSSHTFNDFMVVQGKEKQILIYTATSERYCLHLKI
jgi:hypothetical protein